MREASRNFRYRNRAGAWLDFHLEGLQLAADGALELVGLPRLEPPMVVQANAVPGAIAVSQSGEVIFTQNGHLAARTCTGEVREFDVEAPRALAFSQRRGALLGLYQDRLVLFDLPEVAESETWHGFDDARGLAVDEGGRVYVADAAGVRRYFLTGQQDHSFALGSVAASALALAGEFVFALDQNTVRVFDLDGHAISAIDVGSGIAAGLAADRGSVYVGVADSVLVLNQKSDGALEAAGTASGYTGPVAALATDGGSLWVHPGVATPVALAVRAGYGSTGKLWSKALDAGGRTVEWHRVRAWADVPDASEIQFFVFTGDDSHEDPAFPEEWTEIPSGVTDFYVGEKARYIRVGAVMASDGRSTPRLRQIRTDFDQETYSELLPEIYRLSDSEDKFLERFLGAFRSLFDDAEDRIKGLVAMLDPEAAGEENLDWLAGFLGLELPEGLSTARRREAIKNAFERYAERGTAHGLRNAILAETGVHAVIQEPFAKAAWWQMPARSPDCTTPDQWLPGTGAGLGIGTVFSGASAQGAILGAGAVLDGSHLITNGEYGMPLFADLAHRFNVLLYEGEVACPGKRAAVDRIIEREKPAHTAAHICVVKPSFRIGWQGILGLDTVVGGTAAPSRLGEGALVLGGAEAGRIGESAAVGILTRL